MLPHAFNFEQHGHNDPGLSEHFQNLPLSKHAHRLLQQIGIFKSGLDLSDKNPHQMMEIQDQDGQHLAKKVLDLNHRGYGDHPKIKKLSSYLKGYGFLDDVKNKIGDAFSSVHQHLQKGKYVSKLLNTPIIGTALKNIPVVGDTLQAGKVWAGYGDVKNSVMEKQQNQKGKGKGKRILNK